MSQPKEFIFPFFPRISSDTRIAFSDMTTMCVITSHFFSYNPRDFFLIVCFTFLLSGQSLVISKSIYWCLELHLQSCLLPLLFLCSLSVSMQLLQVNLPLQLSSRLALCCKSQKVPWHLSWDMIAIELKLLKLS